jgi:uncharacterized Zn-binding protein involved in type VI secretion
MPPAATMGDKANGLCTHIIMVPAPPAPPVPTPIPHPFVGTIMGGCSTNVLIGGKPAAIMGATVQNLPPHVPMGPGPLGPPPPTNSGTVIKGSATVLINNKPAVRAGDTSTICATSVVPGTAVIVGTAMTVQIGG